MSKYGQFVCHCFVGNHQNRKLKDAKFKTKWKIEFSECFTNSRWIVTKWNYCIKRKILKNKRRMVATLRCFRLLYASPIDIMLLGYLIGKYPPLSLSLSLLSLSLSLSPSLSPSLPLSLSLPHSLVLLSFSPPNSSLHLPLPFRSVSPPIVTTTRCL